MGVPALAPYAFAGGTAVVTGAASGIGEQLALALAARGSNLVLLDRDAARLACVADAVRAPGSPRRASGRPSSTSPTTTPRAGPARSSRRRTRRRRSW
jgi:NAD(P)-dependent dehydrogenase (short-subunit alcohol dehydrogenase family)